MQVQVVYAPQANGGIELFRTTCGQVAQRLVEAAQPGQDPASCELLFAPQKPYDRSRLHHRTEEAAHMDLYPLTLGDVQPGDIMLKLSDGSILNTLISTGQRITDSRAFANIVHAGILAYQPFIAESQGIGLVLNDLQTTNRSYTYIVFRPEMNLRAAMEQCATVMAHAAMQEENGRVKYSVFGAIKSLVTNTGLSTTDIENTMRRLFGGEDVSFFCSQFVVFCVALAAAQMKAYGQQPAVSDNFLRQANKSPSQLAVDLLSEAAFAPLGWLPSNVR